MKSDIIATEIGFMIGSLINLFWLSLKQVLCVFLILNIGYFCRCFHEKLRYGNSNNIKRRLKNLRKI